MILLLILYCILAIIAILLIGLVVYARWNYGTLEKLNIPVADLSFFLGSNSQLHITIQHYEDVRRFKKYGPVFGVYEGRKPEVYICDLDLIKYITTTDYEYFKNRRVMFSGDPIIDEFLDFQQDEKWKVLRTSLWNPFFNANKLKKFNENMILASNDFILYLDQKCRESPSGLKVDLTKLSNGFLSDCIARSVYGLNIQNPYDQNNYFAKNMALLLGEGQESVTFFHTLTMSFPFLMYFFGSGEFGSSESVKFAESFKGIMETRKATKIRQNDVLDALNDAMEKIKSNDPEYKALNISEFCIEVQALSIMIAGFDPIGTIISHLCYYLSHNQEIYNRLTEEIDNFWKKYNGVYEYENLKELAYLQACINETCRIAPPFIRFERMCTKDWERNGVRIKKGLIIQMPIWAIHRNADVFPDPEEFIPERFLDNKNHLKLLSTFGFGLKNCVGQLFAMQILSIGLVSVLRHFKFSKIPDTQIRYKCGAQIMVKYDPIYFDCTPRNV